MHKSIKGNKRGNARGDRFFPRLHIEEDPTAEISRFQVVFNGQVRNKICCACVCRRQLSIRRVMVRIWYDRNHRFPVFQKRFFVDNLQVQWGSQDHYEIVRKVGRGKYSEVSIAINHESMED